MRYLLNGEHWTSQDPPGILTLLVAHLTITVLTLVIGLAIAVPVALLVARYQRLYLPTITVAGIFYTLPSVAVLALLVPLTGLTTLTVLVPLIAYAQVVLIRNIVAAIRAVDPALVEVGRAMGMNQRQIQLRVVLPLALPVIIAGIRVTTVTTIGIATIAPLVAVQDLGTLIFQGFNFAQEDMVTGGALVIAVFAIGIDLLLLALQRFVGRGRTVGVGG